MPSNNFGLTPRACLVVLNDDGQNTPPVLRAQCQQRQHEQHELAAHWTLLAGTLKLRTKSRLGGGDEMTDAFVSYLRKDNQLAG